MHLNFLFFFTNKTDTNITFVYKLYFQHSSELITDKTS